MLMKFSAKSWHSCISGVPDTTDSIYQPLILVGNMTISYLGLRRSLPYKSKRERIM
jgi:hypothetical protein